MKRVPEGIIIIVKRRYETVSHHTVIKHADQISLTKDDL